jgi:hypothetical protein
MQIFKQYLLHPPHKKLEVTYLEMYKYPGHRIMGTVKNPGKRWIKKKWINDKLFLTQKNKYLIFLCYFNKKKICLLVTLFSSSASRAKVINLLNESKCQQGTKTINSEQSRKLQNYVNLYLAFSLINRNNFGIETLCWIKINANLIRILYSSVLQPLPDKGFDATQAAPALILL